MRLFIAIDLPGTVADMLRSIQSRLSKEGRGASWVKVESIHLTLKFLGDVEDSRIEEIGDELEKAAEGIPPFTLTVEGVSGFPNLRHPRVIWVGVRESTELTQLQGNIEERLQAIGFEKEERPFHPHLTLCRIKEIAAGREFGRAVEALNYDEKVDFRADSFVLFKSVLKPEGAEYTALKRIALKGRMI